MARRKEQNPGAGKRTPSSSKGPKSKKSTPGDARWLLLFTQCAILGCVALGLLYGGSHLFGARLLERYFTGKTGYPCSIETMRWNPWKGMLQLEGVTVSNLDPYPPGVLSRITRIRAEWHPWKTIDFPHFLRLLEVEVDFIHVVRIRGNRFNVYEFGDTLGTAWARPAGVPAKPMLIDEVWIYWEYLIATDREDPSARRVELLMDYEARHLQVDHVPEFTTGPAVEARKRLRGFYMFRVLGDGIRDVFR
jgi:hypothetical protein